MANGDRRSIYDSLYAPSPWEKLVTDLPQQLLDAQKFKFQRDQFDSNEELKALQLLPAHERMAAMKLSKNPTLAAIGDAYGKKSQKIDALIDPVNINFNDKKINEKIDYYESLLVNPDIAGNTTRSNQVNHEIDQLKDQLASDTITKYIANNPNKDFGWLESLKAYDPQEAVKQIKKPTGAMTFSSATSLRKQYTDDFLLTGADHSKELAFLDNFLRENMGMQTAAKSINKEDAKEYALTIKQNNPAWYDDSGVLKPEHQKDMKAELDKMIANPPAAAKVLTQEEKDAAKREAVKKAAEKKRLEEDRKLQEENIKRQNAESLNLAGMMGYEGTNVDEAKKIAQYQNVPYNDVSHWEKQRRTMLRRKYSGAEYKLTQAERKFIKETGVIPERLR